MTEEMQRHYSTVGLDGKRAAIAGVLRLVPPEPGPVGSGGGGTSGGTTFGPTSEAGWSHVEGRFLDEKRREWDPTINPAWTRLVPLFEPPKWDQRWDQGLEFDPNVS